MRSLYAALICICVLLSYTGNAFAQEVEAKKVEGHTWHQLIMVWTMDSIEDMNWEMTPDDIK